MVLSLPFPSKCHSTGRCASESDQWHCATEPRDCQPPGLLLLWEPCLPMARGRWRLTPRTPFALLALLRSRRRCLTPTRSSALGMTPLTSSRSRTPNPMDPTEVRHATFLALGFNIVPIVVAILLVPFTLFGIGWIFTGAGFTGWYVVSFMWV